MNIKIIGKYTVYSFFIMMAALLGAEQKIELQLKSIEGTKLFNAGIGKPFLLDVIITGEGSGLSKPQIKGVDAFAVHNSGYQMYSINNKTTTTYSFTIRIDTTGTYVLGPAVVITDAGKLESNTVKVTVASEEKVKETQKSKRAKSKDVFFRLVSNDKKVVVGQKINGAIRLFYDKNAPDIQQIIEPDKDDLDGLSLKYINKEPILGTKEINGKTYNYAEWQWTAYTDKVGKVVIPAFAVDYLEPVKQTHRNVFFSAFFQQSEVKRTYSNSLIITIDPLPDEKKEIDGIGEFSNFTAKLEPTVAKEGEGVVFTLQLKGTDLDTIKTPQLKKMPQALRAYDSKRAIKPIDDRLSTISFEYIVQGFKQGNWEIPSQTFEFFNTKTRKYELLKSKPVSLQVIANQKISKEKNSINPKKITPEETNDSIKELLELKGPWYPQEEPQIPFGWFILIMLLPITFGLLSQRSSIQKYLGYNELFLRKKRAFKMALKKINHAEKNNNLQDLYSIFIQLFAARLGKKSGAINQQVINTILKGKNLSAHELEQWNIFFNNIATGSFAQIYEDPNKLLFLEAKHWIKQLEKRI